MKLIKLLKDISKEYDCIKAKIDDLESQDTDDSDEEHLDKLFHLDKDLEDLDEEYQKEFSWEVLSILGENMNT